MRIATYAALLVVAVTLSACSSGSDNRYLETRIEGPLELPPDLSEADVGSRFELPAAFITGEDENREKVPVLARVESLRLAGSAGFYWLEVEEPVDSLYRLVKDFWASEGYRLMLDEPVIGIMQTEWVYKQEGGSGESESWFDKIFGSGGLSATQDQFKSRIERDPQSAVSRIYVVHRGTEENPEVTVSQVTADEPSENQWRHRQSEPELEVEMLSRLMVYLGLNRNQVEQQQAQVKLYAPRASLQFDAKENLSYLIMKDAYPVAWNRIYHHIERMNFEITESSLDGGPFGRGSIVVDAGVVSAEEKGGFSSLFSSDTPRRREFSVKFSEESHLLTRVDVEVEGGGDDTAAEANEFINLLYQQVK